MEHKLIKTRHLHKDILLYTASQIKILHKIPHFSFVFTAYSFDFFVFSFKTGMDKKAILELSHIDYDSTKDYKIHH